MTHIIAWPNLCAPGEARVLDATRLVSSGFMLDGDGYFDRAGLKSLIDKGLTTVHLSPTEFGTAVINAGYVEMAAHAAAGNMPQARASFASLKTAQERLMSLTGPDSDSRPFAAVVLHAGWYNVLTTADTFDLALRGDLVEGLEDSLRDIKETRARVNRAKGTGTALDLRRNELRVESLDRVEKDVRLVLSATMELQPANWQRNASARPAQSSVGSSPRGVAVPHDEARDRRQAARKNDQRGCYVATAVYGSYDCPEVWVLRRWRDRRLASTAVGRQIIRTYYGVSPIVVGAVGSQNWFSAVMRTPLDRFVRHLQSIGYSSLPYTDR